MSHTNSTTNYSLPQFVTTDKPAWLTDINGAFSSIDTGMHNAKTTADAAQGDATQALLDASTASTAASGASSKADGALASIANTFNSTSTYLTGDYVIYNNLLYVCIADVSTPGAWTGNTNWSRVTVEDITDGLDGRLDVLENEVAKSFTPSENITVLRSTLIKKGNVKYLSVIFQRTGVTNTIGTVASDCKAVYDYDWTAVSDGGYQGRFRIRANSDIIELAITPALNDYYAFTIAYI